MKMQGPFAKNASWQLAACLCTLRLPCHGPSWLLFALPCIFKNKENARTIRPKSSQASGWHAKRPDMQFHLCFTGQTGPWAQNTPVFTATFGGSQGPPGRAPRGLQEASLQPCPQEAPKRPPRGPQEASSLSLSLSHLSLLTHSLIVFRPLRWFSFLTPWLTVRGRRNARSA